MIRRLPGAQKSHTVSLPRYERANEYRESWEWIMMANFDGQTDG